MRSSWFVPIALLCGCTPSTTETPQSLAPLPSATTSASPAAQQEKREPCPRGMAPVPQGSFLMGTAELAPTTEPLHQVAVKGFCMDPTEVTVDAYSQCVGKGACTAADVGTGCTWGQDGKGNHPITCVDWEQATRYCAWAGKRLPSEEEWEYAARGGAQALKFPWGADPPASRACWGGEGNDLGQGNRMSTCEVGSYPEGAFGLKDMAGNVWEWTSSGWSDDYSQQRIDTLRVRRGGSYFDVREEYLLAGGRGGTPREGRIPYVGFRCAADQRLP